MIKVGYSLFSCSCGSVCNLNVFLCLLSTSLFVCQDMLLRLVRSSAALGFRLRDNADILGLEEMVRERGTAVDLFRGERAPG